MEDIKESSVLFERLEALRQDVVVLRNSLSGDIDFTGVPPNYCYDKAMSVIYELIEINRNISISIWERQRET